MSQKARIAVVLAVSAIVVGAIAVGVGLGLSRTGDAPQAPEHVHAYTEQIQSPTCTESGRVTYICECSDRYTEEIPAWGHSLKTHAAQAPTCTENGWEEYVTCERAGCGHSTYRAVPATGAHRWGEGEIVRPATCSEAGEMRFLCMDCQTATKTEPIATLEHVYTEEWHSDADGHWYECACGQKTMKLSHGGGTATCMEQARCAVCDQPYGTLAEHTYKTLLHDEEGHWYECACGDRSDTVAHTGGTATCMERAQCAECGEKYGPMAAHTYTTLRHNADEHWYECACGDRSAAAAHAGGKATCLKRALCAECEQPYGLLGGHEHSILKFDANRHWYECACGNQASRTTHGGGTATCTEKANCATCGQAYGKTAKHSYTTLKFDEDTHWYECVCGERSGEGRHIGSAACQERAHCSVCGQEYGQIKGHNFTILKYDEQQHWYECSCGEKEAAAAHGGGEATCVERAACATCGQGYGTLPEHRYDTLNYDQEAHWYECECGGVVDKAAHTGGEATCTQKAICTVCAQEYGSMPAHDYATRKYNADTHWFECRCGAKTDEAAHDHATMKYHAERHWLECACGAKAEETVHTGGEATCTERAVCSVCAQAYGEALGHIEKTHEGKIPVLCTESGWHEYVTCEREGCGYTTYREIPAKGTHTWKQNTVIAAQTCTGDGLIAHVCDCGATETELILAQGHQYGDLITVREADCTTDGLQTQTCSVCGDEQRSILPMHGHDYVAVEERVVESIPETVYQCEICEEIFILQGESTPQNVKAEEFLFDCPQNFTFLIVCRQDEAYIRNNLMLVGAYDAAHANPLAYTLVAKEDGVWEVVGANTYEAGNAYTATVQNEVALYGYDAQALTFRIRQEERENIEVDDGILFLKALEEQYGGYYPYQTIYSGASDQVWLSVGRADGLVVGSLLCVGDAKAAGDLFDFSGTAGASTLGKIKDIYPMEDGTYLIALVSPALSEVFDVLDVYQSEVVDFEEVNFELSEEFQEQTVRALYASRGFAEFMTSVSLGSASYLSARNMDTSPASEETLIDRLKITPDVDIEGATLKCTLTGYLDIPIKSKDGKIDFGSIVISFVADASFGIVVDYAVEVEWDGSAKLELNLIQSTEFGFAFDVKIDIDYTQEGVETGEFVYCMTTLTIHNAKCRHVDQIKDKRAIVRLTGEEAVTYLHNGKGKECKTCSPIASLTAQSYILNNSKKVVHQCTCPNLKNVETAQLVLTNLGIDQLPGWERCGTCHPEQREEQDFTTRLQNSAKFEQWEDTFNQVGEKLDAALKDKYNGEPLTDDLKLGHVEFRIRMLQLNLDLYFELNFQFDATLSLDYRIRYEKTYGLGIYNGSLRTWDSESREVLAESLELVGSASAQAGLRLDVYGSIAHLEDWIQLGLYGRVGAYAEAKGILHIDNVAGESYVGAYFETGVYTELGCFYKLVNWGGRFSFGERRKFPLAQLGVSKVYYTYKDTLGDLLLSADYELRAEDVLQVTYYDLRTGESKTETLSFAGVDGVYTVSLRLKEGKYCHMDGNTIVIHDNAPSKFTDTLYVSVTGTKGWEKYFITNSAFNLGEYEIAIEFDSDAHPWVEVDRAEASCLEFGWVDYVCSECGKTKREMLDKAAHVYDANDTCVVCHARPWDNKEVHYVNTQQKLITHMGYYGLYQEVYDELDLSSLAEFFSKEYVITFSFYMNMQYIDPGEQEIYLYDRSYEAVGRYKQSSQFSSSIALERGMVGVYKMSNGSKDPMNYSFQIELEGSKCNPIMTLCYDANGTDEDDWLCNYIEVVITVRRADWLENCVSFGGHNYYVFDLSDITSYQNAVKYCESLGGYMATITSQAENDFLFNYIKSLGYTDVYFGLSDAAKEGTWVWLNGEVSSYSNWAPGEPSTAREDYAMFYSSYSDGKWNDGDFGNTTLGKSRLFLCEWGPY